MNVFVKAYLKSNFGDDLFIKILLERYPNHHFFLFANKEYNLILKNFNNYTLYDINSYKLSLVTRIFEKIIRTIDLAFFKRYHQRKLLFIYRKPLKKADLILTIGGSLFIHKGIYKFNNNNEFYKAIINKFASYPKFILGSNFGPYDDDDYKRDYDNILKNFTDVCFRDKTSFKLFNSTPNVRYAPDIVFNLNLKKIAKEKNIIGFSVVPPTKYIGNLEIDHDAYKRKYISLINHMLSEGYKIRLFSFCKHEGDEDFINELCNEIGNNKNLEKVFYSTEIDVFLESIQEVDTLICGRFHAMILGLISNINIIPICYSNKMYNVLKDIDFNGKIIRFEDFYKTDNDSFLRRREGIMPNLKSYIDDSGNQFLQLDKILI